MSFELGGAAAVLLLAVAFQQPEVYQAASDLWHDTSISKWEDFTTSAVAACVFCLLRWYTFRLLLPYAKYVLKKKHQHDQNKASRWATVSFKFLFYVFIVSLEVYLFWGAPYIPKELGGSEPALNRPGLSWAEANDKYVAQLAVYQLGTYKFNSGEKFFYLVTLGYHLHSFLWTIVIDFKRGDFIEMAVHHIATVIAIVFSYMEMWIPMGIIVMIIHDIIDVLAYLAKGMSDTKFDITKVLVYIWVTSGWGYVRLWAFPRATFLPIVRHWAVHGFSDEGAAVILVDPEQLLDASRGIKICMVLLIILWCLHVYWFWLFLVAWARFCTPGQDARMLDTLEGERCAAGAERFEEHVGIKASGNTGPRRS